MFAKLSGVIAEIDHDSLVLDVGGVGYLVSCSSKTMHALAGEGQMASLFIETLVRQEQIQLIGFASKDERDWFKILFTVQGVGARVALAILSVLEPSELISALVHGDKAMIARADGVGPKLASRLLTELKDKASSYALKDGVSLPIKASFVAPTNSVVSDAVSALTNLGYSKFDALKATSYAVEIVGEGAALQSLLPVALSHLSNH